MWKMDSSYILSKGREGGKVVIGQSGTLDDALGEIE